MHRLRMFRRGGKCPPPSPAAGTRSPFAAKLMAAGVVMVLVWLPWLALTVWMAKSGIPRSERAAAYAKLPAADKAKLIAGYSGF